MSEQGVSALHVASLLGADSAAELLLQHGADINSVDAINGWTPLLYAIYYKWENKTWVDLCWYMLKYE